jgi:predicted metal-dependent hydrolase
LCVVVPHGFDTEQVPALLTQKQAWIEKALLDVGNARPRLAADYLPEDLNLAALNEAWQIDYCTGGKRARLSVDTESSRLLITAQEQEQQTVFHLLRGWLAQHAKASLLQRLDALGTETGLRFNRMTIRNQRSRWGSCSSRKNLSLNLKLLFLQPEQLRYVLVHELCHTVQMNHSRAFWRLVENHQPGALELRKSMRKAWQAVPLWVSTV